MSTLLLPARRALATSQRVLLAVRRALAAPLRMLLAVSRALAALLRMLVRRARGRGAAVVPAGVSTGVLTGLLLLAGCDQFGRAAEESLPPVDVVETMYDRHGLDATFRYSGNVLELVVQQPEDQLRRGGSLWARVGPYIYVFAPATREVLERYPAIAGVRVITMVGETEVARALLLSDRLNDITWRRAQNALGRALEEGTSRPSLLDRLVQFGEEYTEFAYRPEWVGR